MAPPEVIDLTGSSPPPAPPKRINGPIITPDDEEEEGEVIQLLVEESALWKGKGKEVAPRSPIKLTRDRYRPGNDASLFVIDVGGASVEAIANPNDTLRVNQNGVGASSSGTLENGSSKMKKRRRKGKGSKSGTNTPATPNSPPMFYIDVDPASPPSDLPQAPTQGPQALEDPSAEEPARRIVDGLLLPSHVLVTDEPSNRADVLTDGIDGEAPHSPSSTSSHIEFLDDERGVQRYFDTGPDTSGPKCRSCGERGHMAAECTLIVCLTCGTQNEHTTRSCPISIVCFRCGERGHIQRDCTHSWRHLPQGCTICRSGRHAPADCPTHWRTYTYLSSYDRERHLLQRADSAKLGMGEGGEGFIGWGEGCYNCGRMGHWGDDCERVSRSDRPLQTTSFSSNMASMGPFATSKPNKQTAAAIDRIKEASANLLEEEPSTFDDGYGFRGEAQVGKKGREAAKKKNREADRKRERERDNDEEDWFSKRTSSGKNGGGGGGSNKKRKKSKEEKMNGDSKGAGKNGRHSNAQAESSKSGNKPRSDDHRAGRDRESRDSRTRDHHDRERHHYDYDYDYDDPPPPKKSTKVSISLQSRDRYQGVPAAPLLPPLSSRPPAATSERLDYGGVSLLDRLGSAPSHLPEDGDRPESSSQGGRRKDDQERDTRRRRDRNKNRYRDRDRDRDRDRKDGNFGPQYRGGYDRY